MTVLLTGATGFVGSNLVLRARQMGWRVLAPVRDPAKLGRLLQRDGLPADAAVALPADPGLWPSPLRIDGAVLGAGALFERSLRDYLRTNVAWNLAALGRIPDGCPTVVLSSQSAGGPTPAAKAARAEDDPDEPVSWYGESKLRLERAIRRLHPKARIAILRPPMVLGPRDTAALQLFRAARAPVRPKPGLRRKSYSFVAVGDLLDAIERSLEEVGPLLGRPWYVASRQRFTDRVLLRTVAASLRAHGITLPVPHAAVRAVSAVVGALPSLSARLPSLGPDRVREVLEDRWVVDPSAFEHARGWVAKTSLAAAIQAARDHYVAAGAI